MDHIIKFYYPYKVSWHYTLATGDCASITRRQPVRDQKITINALYSVLHYITQHSKEIKNHQNSRISPRGLTRRRRIVAKAQLIAGRYFLGSGTLGLIINENKYTGEFNLKTWMRRLRVAG
jgi:hypothetical protein